MTNQPGHWTRIEDDTGGGASLSNHERLYIEGSESEAGILLFQLFDLTPDRSTREYGSVFAFKQFPSFDLASAYDRGCEWVRGEPYPRPNEPSSQSWREFVPAQQWRESCQADLGAARHHRNNHDASRAGARFVAARAEVLAVCLPEWDDGVGRDGDIPGKIDAAIEYVKLSRQEGAAWASSPNASALAASFARVVALGLKGLLQDDPAKEGSWMAQWRAVGKALGAEDIGLAFRLNDASAKAAGIERQDTEVGAVAEALAMAWALRSAPPNSSPGAQQVLNLACGLGDDDLALAAAMSCECAQDQILFQNGKQAVQSMASWLESLAIERHAALAPSAKTGPRL
jgi:hypothetical protein